MSTAADILKQIEDQEQETQQQTVETSEKPKEKATDKSYLLETISNVPSSAVKLGRDILAPIFSPIETAKSIGAVGASVISLLRPGEQGNEELAQQVGQFYADRYGSLENIKRTFSQDPVGFFADVGLVLTGVGGGVRAAGGAATTAKKISDAGRLVDATTLAGKALTEPTKLTGRGLRTLSGTVTGTGTGPLKQAFQSVQRPVAEAGQSAEDAATALQKAQDIDKNFTDALRGRVDETTILKEAQEGLKILKRENSTFYKTEEAKYLTQLKKDKVSKKDINEIKNLVSNFRKDNPIAVGEDLDKVLRRLNKQIQSKIDGVKTVKDLDDLRKKVNQVPYPNEPNAIRGYSFITDEIRDRTYSLTPPGYREFLSDYGDKVSIVQDVVKELSIGGRGSKQTAINKLLRVLSREGGIAADTLRTLPNADKLIALLSGYSLNPAIPSGLSRGLTAGLFQSGVVGGGLVGSAAASSVVPGLIGLAAVSPRLAGETTRVLGQTARGVNRLTPGRATVGGIRQVGAIQEEMERQGLL